MIKTDTINRYNQVQTTKLYTVTVQFELKLWQIRVEKLLVQLNVSLLVAQSKFNPSIREIRLLME